MTTQLGLDPTNRIDFVYLFDVADGNPNGDPDAGNAPRTDPETGQGLVSDVSLKRKVRDWVAMAKAGEERFNIYVKLHSGLHEQREPAYRALGIEQGSKKGAEKATEVENARAWMCQNYYDVRAFGAVMSMEEFNCGQVRGPFQITFARSISPIADLEQSIVRKAVEKKDAKEQMEKDGTITGTFGRKSIVPYALYRAHVFYNPAFARSTGFDAEDLALTVDALRMMFDVDRSAARGQMAARGLYAFAHSSALGNAPAAGLLDRVVAAPVDPDKPARKFSDYAVTVDEDAIPAGVTFHRLL